MKRAGLLLCFLAGVLGSARAQIAVEIKLDQDEFLSGEPIIAAVRVSNRSGRTLRLGEDSGWLSLSAQGEQGMFVEKTGDVPAESPFDLESAHVATKPLDLASCFNFIQPGRYGVVATVRIKGWEAEFSSKRASFEVLKGTRLWQQEFGVPGSGNGEPEMRKYALQQANYLHATQLYVRVTDALEARIFRVFQLGPIVPFGKPEVQVDKWSNLHVLFQTGQRSFLYSVVNPSAKLVIRQSYDYYADSRPKLALDDKADIIVRGGIRHTMPTDLPPRLSEVPTNDVAPPKL